MVDTYHPKMMIVMRRDLKMRKGKIAAQANAVAGMIVGDCVLIDPDEYDLD